MQDGTQGQWRRAGATGALPEGGILGAVLDGHRIAIYRRDGQLHATDGLCTHAWVPLEDGLLDGYEIECPVHQARFDTVLSRQVQQLGAAEQRLEAGDRLR